MEVTVISNSMRGITPCYWLCMAMAHLEVFMQVDGIAYKLACFLVTGKKGRNWRVLVATELVGKPDDIGVVSLLWFYALQQSI